MVTSHNRFSPGALIILHLIASFLAGCAERPHSSSKSSAPPSLLAVMKLGHSLKLAIRIQDDLIDKLGLWGLYYLPHSKTVTRKISRDRNYQSSLAATRDSRNRRIPVD